MVECRQLVGRVTNRCCGGSGGLAWRSAGLLINWCRAEKVKAARLDGLCSETEALPLARNSNSPRVKAFYAPKAISLA